MVLVTLDIHMLKNDTGPLSPTTHTHELEGINVFSVRPETMKLLKEIIGEELPDMSLGNGFLDLSLKAQAIKAKTDN